MAFVLDASMAMSWCFQDEATVHNRGVLAALENTYAEVPPLWPYEIAKVLAIDERRQRITEAISSAFLQTLAGLDIRNDQVWQPIDGKALLPLVRRHGLTAYDAAYLELAKRSGLPPATLDAELIQAAPLEGVVLVSYHP